MSEFLELFQKHKDEFSIGLITTNEFFNYLIRFINENLDSLENDLPPELISIANRYSLGLSKETINRNRWYRFIHKFMNFDCYDHSLEEFYKVFDFTFTVKYLENQKFKVIRSFRADCIKYYKAPYTGWEKIKLKEGLILYTPMEIFLDETEVELLPLDYLGFQKKHIEPSEIFDPYYSCYYLRIKTDIFEKHCCKCKNIATINEMMQSKFRYIGGGKFSKN